MEHGVRQVATLLSIDVAGAFDHVSAERMLHNLRKRKIPEWIVAWVGSFLQQRRSTLTIGGQTSSMRLVHAGIPQGSPVSPILYIFYNADILEELERSRLKVTALGFIDDINILAYGTSTESNCRALERAHEMCELWARRHGAHFAPAKYELLHLARNDRRFDMTAAVCIGGVDKTPSPSVRVLGIQIDSKLKWGPHLKFIQGKMATQTLALSRLTASTWGACFTKARHVYSAVVRPAITFGSTVWHSPYGRPDGTQRIDKQLGDIQRECLRVISGGFRATPQIIIEAETHVSPIQLHLAHLQAKARRRLKEHEHDQRISAFCEKIKRKLTASRGRRRRALNATPAQRKRDWYTRQIARVRPADMIEDIPTDRGLAKIFNNQWKQTWSAYQAAHQRHPCAALTEGLSIKRLGLHKNFSKSESSLIIQMRTERIGLADYLFSRRVPTFASPACSCGWARQTLKYVLLSCPRFVNGRSNMCRDAGTTDYRRLLTTEKGLRASARWLMRTNLLTQFSLAVECLSSSP